MRQITDLLRTVLLCLLLSASALLAQSGDIDLEGWERVAQRAEQAVEAARASDDALLALRADVVGYRDQWLVAQSANDPRLQTLQSQLDALGPVPEEGEEPTEISERRAELSQQIAVLEAPLRRAEEAFTRADGLVNEIDAILRSRQTDALLERGSAPINPRIWPDTLSELGGSFQKIATEARDHWRNDVQRTEFINHLPATLVTLAIALLFLFRAPAMVERLGTWLRGKTRRGTGVWTTLLSLLRVVLPVLGLTLFVQAMDVAGLLGPFGTHVLDLLPFVLFVVLFTQWLVAQRFSVDAAKHMVVLPPERRNEARYYANGLAWLLALDILVTGVGDYASWSPSTLSVLSLPIHVLCGLILYRLGRIMRATEPMEADGAPEADTVGFVTRLARWVGRGAMAIGVVGPVLSALGYFNLAQALIFPTILTIGLFGLLLTIQAFLRDVYHLVTGQDLDQTESLWPVFSGVVLTLAALPILALIWGARVEDLTELWAQFRAGFTIGGTRISPTDFLTFVLVFAMGYAATRLLQGGLRSSVLPKTKIDQGGQTAIVSGVGYVGIFLSAIIAITTAGIDLSALALVAGALSVGIGFGLQNIVQNFISGIILLVERPIAEGDWIEVNGQHGTVRDISVRSTRIETFDRTDVIVPNADLIANAVTNYTRGNVIGRLIVDVGVAYGTDTRKVEDILYKIARNHDMVLMNPAPFVHFKGFGADSLDFDVRMILRDVTSILAVRTEINHQIVEAFAKEGIEIPFAQRDIWLRNPETLHPPLSEQHRRVTDEAPSASTPSQSASAHRDIPDGPEEDAT